MSAIPVTDHNVELSGLPTAVLEGGEGRPIVLLHGPGETSLWWMRVIPELATTNRVIVPDLPGHGATGVMRGILEPNTVLSWLGELIESRCSHPPTLVGHLLGGSIAARFSSRQGDTIDRLVLVDSLGLGKFRPAPGFAFRLIRFLVRPTAKNYSRFLPHCMYDAEDLRTQMGEYWEPFLKYHLECARDPDRRAALRMLMSEVGTPEIPSEDLEQIDVPTALIWGRHDVASRLHIAESASERFQWPLHVIDGARDDPKLEQPEAFLRALYRVMNA